MSAQRQIIAALSEDSMGGIATLHDVTHAEQLVNAYRVEMLRTEATNLRRVEREATPQGALGTRTGLLRAALILDERADLVGEKSSREPAADATPGEGYPGETDMLRGLVATLRARVDELQTERHTTNEVLADITVAIREREASPLTVYRASRDAIVMGLYTTAAEARKHCEAEERRSWYSADAPSSFGWIEDEEDGVAEMTAWVGGEECVTGYEVTPLEIAASYDPDADE